MRLAARLAAGVPFTSPAAPFSTPPRHLPAASQLQKLRTLNVNTLGSRTNRSLILGGRDSVKSKVRSQARLVFPGGAVWTVGESAPSRCSCDRESKPALTRAWPAGVN